MKTRNTSISGFSLVEVTLALGVVVFCLVTILGLLAVGINSTHVSTAQTAATNILTAVASDVEATPNITPSFSSGLPAVPSAKGTKSETSLIYGIVLPPGAIGTANGGTTGPTAIYIGENGQVTTKTQALYQLNYWVTTAGTNAGTIKQETFVRLLITWPATVLYGSAPNYVENVIAVNRT